MGEDNRDRSGKKDQREGWFRSRLLVHGRIYALQLKVMIIDV